MAVERFNSHPQRSPSFIICGNWVPFPAQILNSDCESHFLGALFAGSQKIVLHLSQKLF